MTVLISRLWGRKGKNVHVPVSSTGTKSCKQTLKRTGQEWANVWEPIFCWHQWPCFDLVTKNGNMKSVFSRIVLPSSQTNTSAGKVWHARQLNHTDRYQVVNAGIYFPSKRIRVQTVAFLLQCDDMTSLSLFFLIIIYFPNILCQNISFVFNTFSGSHLQYMYSFSGSCHLLFNSGNLQQRLRGLPENLNWSPWQGSHSFWCTNAWYWSILNLKR